MEVSAAVVLLRVGMSELAESDVVELPERVGMLESEVVVPSSVDVVVAEAVASVDVAVVSVLSEVVADAVVVADVVPS